jgi:hypothetical protein
MNGGQVASHYWMRIPDHFDHVQLDAWVVMPNHLHGILVIVGRGEASPTTAFSADNLTRSSKSSEQGGSRGCLAAIIGVPGSHRRELQIQDNTAHQSYARRPRHPILAAKLLGAHHPQ